MADTYPWGALAPVKRVAAVESQIAANDKKRNDCVEAHKKRMAEIDETDRRLKGDLRQATAVVEREAKEATVAAATKAFEKVMASLYASGVDVSEIVRGGDLEKVLGKAMAEAGAKPRSGRKAASTSSAPAPSASEAASPEVPPVTENGPSGDGTQTSGDGPGDGGDAA